MLSKGTGAVSPPAPGPPCPTCVGVDWTRRAVIALTIISAVTATILGDHPEALGIDPTVLAWISLGGAVSAAAVEAISVVQIKLG